MDIKILEGDLSLFITLVGLLRDEGRWMSEALKRRVPGVQLYEEKGYAIYIQGQIQDTACAALESHIGRRMINRGYSLIPAIDCTGCQSVNLPLGHKYIP
jgi:hypothetical protein